MAKRNRQSKAKHPWRKCPRGKYWVSEHPRKVKKTRRNPDGITIVDGHCKTNPSRKDQIYSDELKLIKAIHFGKVKKLPKKDNLDFKWKGNRYDTEIAAWTQFWNETLNPSKPLDPNLVKALIATESSFEREAKVFAGKRAGQARGLMQVTDWTIEILQDEKGELRDYLVNVTQKDMMDPNLNIAAGVRWLYRKRQTASAKLKRQASWEEAVADYKSYLEKWRKNPKHQQMNRFLNLYERLKKK